MALPLFNQLRRFMLVFLRMAAGFIVLGFVAIMIGTLVGPTEGPSDARAAGAIIGIVSFVFGVTMLICAAATWPAARRADRLLAEMTAVEPLAHWVYPEPFWRAWIDRDARGRGWIAWLIAGFIFVVAGLCIYGLLTPSDPNRPVPYVDAAIFAIVAAALIVITFLGFGSYRNRRRSRLLRHAECYITPTAVYIGGDLIFWNAQMRALRGVKLVEGDPPYIEYTVGMTQGAATANKAVGLAMLAAGKGGYVGDYVTTTQVPVPTEALGHVQDVILKIQGG